MSQSVGDSSALCSRPLPSIFALPGSVPPGYSHSRLPYIYGMLVQRDYYGIEWPPVFRAWNFGTYVHETLAHHFPGLLGVITGIGAFVAP